MNKDKYTLEFFADLFKNYSFEDLFDFDAFDKTPKSKKEVIEVLRKLKALADRPGTPAEGEAARARIQIIQKKYEIGDF